MIKVVWPQYPGQSFHFWSACIPTRRFINWSVVGPHWRVRLCSVLFSRGQIYCRRENRLLTMLFIYCLKNIDFSVSWVSAKHHHTILVVLLTQLRSVILLCIYKDTILWLSLVTLWLWRLLMLVCRNWWKKTKNWRRFWKNMMSKNFTVTSYMLPMIRWESALGESQRQGMVSIRGESELGESQH